MIGTKKYANTYEISMFPRNFFKLTMMLLTINIPVAVIAINQLIVHGEKMGAFFRLWIVADVSLIFLTHLNIYIEFYCNVRNDMKRIEYILKEVTVILKA
jgi:hypothetical protein